MSSTDAVPTEPIQLADPNEFDDYVADGVVLVDFHADWCGPCQMMEPAVEAVASDTDAAVLTIDIESHLETAIEFGAQSAPTFVLFVDGQPVKQLQGGHKEQSLRDLVATYGG